ncbi:MAG: LpxA family transferase [Candidatus Latescibacteria bacterium]|jgi:UDP-N-acetylglucosamine diphosphorylase / glucose-1-phosphate thymidylyltransferase / UDP-N-acetylgalactosamine diphosphorylase / glucosamine-1-phosphate N-acetyltransferase / galactosamine-1-phosphate N-acetyltransferase|nr:LpxA family transferase [Candidatus Latescibacterota bacterium]
MNDYSELYALTSGLRSTFPLLDLSKAPWTLVGELSGFIQAMHGHPAYVEYRRVGQALIHPGAIISDSAVIDGPALISNGCELKTNAYLREGVMLAPGCIIGSAVELKASVIGEGTALAHFNYVGNSVLGSRVNMEAGAVVANHHNESPGKSVVINYAGDTVNTGAMKFGALVGDDSKVGANAVLSPGTILLPETVVGRLALIDQSQS